nr:unnamed protein product [Spirometra erinaceieuropaei]
MRVVTIPALQDNYMYLVIDDSSKQCAAVDPVAPSTVLKAVAEQGLQLTSILTTHHHWDHAGGNVELVKSLKAQGTSLEVYGGGTGIAALTTQVQTGDEITLGDRVIIKCLSTPCHTQDHICYYATDRTNPSDEGCVFTGDTLFLAGCGRFFEGTPMQMQQALEVLAKLPESTKIYCGHEYTLKNLQFAQTVEPDNIALKERIERCKLKRNSGQPTVPGTIAEELATNPFMRTAKPSIQSHTKTTLPVDTMEVLRQQKDAF